MRRKVRKKPGQASVRQKSGISLVGRAKLWQDALHIFDSISKTRLAPKLETTR